jgi:predicted neuraminidase
LRYPLSDRTRQPMPAGGLFSTAADVARFARMILNEGQLDGRRYLSAAAVKTMTSRQTPAAMKEGYGLGWTVGVGEYGHGGALGTETSIEAKSGLITIFLIQQAGFIGDGSQLRGEFKRTARSRFGGAPSAAVESSAVATTTGVGRAAASPPALVTHEFIYEQASYPSCHASTIVETAQGGLVAAWFGGTAEKNPDVGIWVSHYDRVAQKWTPSVEVANGVQTDGKRHPTWNPVLFQPRGGAPLLLFYKVGPSPQTWWGEVRTSTDGGKSWSASRRLPAGIYGPIKNKPVQLADGTILSPTSDETDERPSKWRIYFERSTDGGATWAKTPFFNDGLAIGAIQPSILFHDGLGGSKLQAVGRTRQGKVFTIASPDAGQTWGEIALLDGVPNPNSGTDAVTLRDGRHVLVYNPVSKGRTPLVVAVSRDGRDWKQVVTLEDQPGEYSYPAIIQTADGRLHITYTWKRQRIRHAVIDPAKF